MPSRNKFGELTFYHGMNIGLRRLPDCTIRASPDIADALALTFARPVFPRQYDNMGRGNVVSDYDPIQEFEREQSGRPRTPQRYYAPGYARLLDEYE